jgi:hypothetical protein
MYVVFLAVVRYLFSMPYRQLEGFTRALHRLIPRLPPVDYSWVRRRILRLDLRPYTSLESYEGPVSIAVDSSGVRVYGRRWAVETAFSTYKRLYGEYCMSRNIENIERELKAKAYIYNTL